ncbi:hypothetical protein AB7C87_02455 [Natrarchaeobius sp. A-rgal3]|uniref:hypothetical protein n=1 Tax=Natrarchaeobius versutus TaxID=1679078 RepID=UPI003510D03F
MARECIRFTARVSPSSPSAQTADTLVAFVVAVVYHRHLLEAESIAVALESEDKRTM